MFDTPHDSYLIARSPDRPMPNRAPPRSCCISEAFSAAEQLSVAVDFLLLRLLLGETLVPDLITGLAVGGLVPSLPRHRVLSGEQAAP